MGGDKKRIVIFLMGEDKIMYSLHYFTKLLNYFSRADFSKRVYLYDFLKTLNIPKKSF